MARENKTYPIILNGNYDDPVGSVATYINELESPTWSLVPIIGGQIESVGAPRTLKGFSVRTISVEQQMMHIPSHQADDVMEKIYAKQAARMAERDALRKEILLEIIESITNRGPHNNFTWMLPVDSPAFAIKEAYRNAARRVR